MSKTDFSETSKAPHIDSIAPDFQKKIDGTTTTINSIHTEFNLLEGVFEAYAHNIQNYTELQRTIHTRKEDERKKVIKDNTLKITEFKKQIPRLQKQAIAIQKSLEPIRATIAEYQGKIDLYASQLAILGKQMQTNIIVAQVKRVKDQMTEARSHLVVAEEESQKRIAEGADIQTQIANINKNIPLLQSQIVDSSQKDETSEDKKNISETKNLITDITTIRDDIDNVKADIYNLEKNRDQLFAHLTEYDNDSLQKKLDAMYDHITSLQKRMEYLHLLIDTKNSVIDASVFVAQLQS